MKLFYAQLAAFGDGVPRLFERRVTEAGNDMDSLQRLEPASRLLLNAFKWKDTPEGHEYWSNIYEKIDTVQPKRTPLIYG